MPLKNYGVLKGTVVSYEGERDDETPHLHAMIEAGGRKFRSAINVKSRQRPSELVYLEDSEYSHPQLPMYSALPPGFKELESRSGSGALDYIRGNLFDFEKVVAVPHSGPGPKDDLIDQVSMHLERARQRPASVAALIFGEPFPDGIHDVHMNQGSAGAFAKTNGTWQDGAVLLLDRERERCTALFLAFQSQAIHTDDAKGNALPGSATFEDVVAGRLLGRITRQQLGAPAPDGVLRIVAALVNPNGPDDQKGGESVTLLNSGLLPIDLTGWVLASGQTSRMILTGLTVDAGATVRVPVEPPLVLSNRGGIISILDPAGRRVHGVSYTRAQAAHEGLSVAFQ